MHRGDASGLVEKFGWRNDHHIGCGLAVYVLVAHLAVESGGGERCRGVERHILTAAADDGAEHRLAIVLCHVHLGGLMRCGHVPHLSLVGRATHFDL